MVQSPNLDILPFPSDINRDAFGHWLSGFVDGEGCFMLMVNKYQGYLMPSCRFIIHLRADDFQILRTIQSFLQCGTIYHKAAKDNAKDNSFFVCYDVWRSLDNIIPHFEAYPLRAKKARDFAIWKRGVEVMAKVRVIPREALSKPGDRYGGFASRWTPETRAEFDALVAELKQVRNFQLPTELAPLFTEPTKP